MSAASIFWFVGGALAAGLVFGGLVVWAAWKLSFRG